jgi:hypothetical protein
MDAGNDVLDLVFIRNSNNIYFIPAAGDYEEQER